uniref:Autophagy-related protein 2 n=1 Tax=Heterorhabditis bacteriophora TaxID=37862 RepID=A0A1I7WZ98_HETBA
MHLVMKFFRNVGQMEFLKDVSNIVFYICENIREFVSYFVDTDDDELMDERSHPSCDYTEYERNKMHNLSLMLNIKKGTLLMGTIVNEKGLGQISVDLSDAQLFTVTGYHGQLNETFFYFTTNTVSIGQKNFSCTIPKSVYQKEFGKWFREDTQLETIGISDEFSNHSKGDVIGVAVHLHNRSDSNVKDILLAIAMRNTCDLSKIAYTLMIVILIRDLYFRLVLDQTNISSAVIQDMNVSKVIVVFRIPFSFYTLYLQFVCIFEGSRLFISSQKKSTDGVSFDESRKFNSISSNTRREKQFIQIVDVGLFQLEVLLSLNITCDLNGRRAPMVEIRCSNDIIKIFISTAISASYTANSNNPLPKLVEMKMKVSRMLESAIQEPSPGNIRYHETNPCGTDALKEFSRNYSFAQAQNKEFPVAREDESSDRNRAYSLSTDDEFCMVDDIIGSGITLRDFSEVRVLYLVRDFSIRLHLYGGSDLSEDPPKPRNYSVDEYREGKGRNQKVTSEMMGGKHRDQSVSVVLDLDKITFLYQMFNKDAPLMCTTLFSVYNVTLLDKLQLSSIKEMMFSCCLDICITIIKYSLPRRTCAPMLAIRMVETHTCEGKMRVMAASASTRPVMGIPSEHRAKSAEDNILYPALSKHNSLNLEPLLPSPVAPPSPLGDLSFLENRSSGGSPVKRPLIDAPLTASAVSIGDLFVTKPNASKRVLSSESDISSRENLYGEYLVDNLWRRFFNTCEFQHSTEGVCFFTNYHGKNKINMEKSGAVLGVLKGIGQLNRTEIVLKEIIHRNGLLGVGRCVNIGKGVMDLFWLPVVELRKEDGHVVKGIQKGMGSFSLSSAAGIVGMAQTVVGVVQVRCFLLLIYNKYNLLIV